MEGNPYPTAHLVGVCGAGMKALAELLLDREWRLSGSDLLPPSATIHSLMARGLVFHQGHSVENIPSVVDQVVYSPAVPAQNAERCEALRRGIPQDSYSQMVGRLMRDSSGVCIAGTHGKSTTTAMTACILTAAGRLGAVVMGAELRETGRSGWSHSGDLFVAESCEFQRSFLDFSPQYAAILGIEPDHFDCYPDLTSLETAFRRFAERTSPDGVLLVNDDCPRSRAIARHCREFGMRCASFGEGPSADWSAGDSRMTRYGQQFVLSHQGREVSRIDLRLFGSHNRQNAMAAAALCGEIGVPFDLIQRSLAEFHGIRRRMEFVGEWNGAMFVDDYAHHPTAVRVTLQTLRSIVGKRPLRCVFQPHQLLRTTSLMDEFAGSFTDADEVLIAPVFAAREAATDQPRQVSAELAQRISLQGTRASSYASLDQIVSTLEDAILPGDVIVTMGAGDIDRIYHEFTRRVQADPSAG